jgi:starch-binding outer membrane protein, SusD/RagB family
MRKYINLSLIILSVSLFSCEKAIEPKSDNILSYDELIKDPVFTEGILMKAYYATPNDYIFETEIASDEAVTNDPSSAYRNMAIGSWRSTNNPISQWGSAYSNIFYINHFLDIYQNVNWSTNPNLTLADNVTRNALHKKRLKGEAFGLRAWYKWRLLQYHGGWTNDGRLLGFPIINVYLTQSDNWELPRNTFAECVNSIFADLDTAIANLPKTWVDLPTGGTNPAINGHINATSGARFLNRLNGNTARALKARVALLAASQAFSAGSGVTWAQAATMTGPFLKDLGSLSATGRVFYKNRVDPEIIWNRSEVQKRNWEQDNFPPSLFGNGRTNPTQNLVNAFPSKNGYPINHPSNTTYNPANPYANRDARLTDYVVYNASVLKTVPIYTYIGATSNGINVLLTSTRTGYYLKKLLSESVSLTPGAVVSAGHTYTLFRTTEVLLNYAEAANEAWGPDGDPNGYGFTARTKIRDLRNRGGVTQPDAYLASITDANGLRDLIRNERRIELCFEGFRFWDIRRWNDVATMQTSAKAANITNTAGVYTYVYSDVEERKYAPYMIYGPIPYSETLKYNLEQNKDW